MSPARRGGRTLHTLFTVGVIGKGIDGVLETAGGVLLLLANPARLSRLVRTLTQHELIEDPRDLVATALRHAVEHLSSGTQTFAAVYLLLHGVVKVGLVAALLRRQLWAYPAAMLVFGVFLAYQLYRWSHTHANLLVALSALDVIVIGLTYVEYQRLQRAPVGSRR